MSRSSPWLPVIAAGVIGIVGLLLVYLDYRSDLAPLRERESKARGFIAAARAEESRHEAVLDELDALAARTLGGDRETVDHRLRSHLNRIGEAVGLAGLSVNTTRYAARPTPARTAFSSRRERSVRDEVDFVEVEGTVSGEGSLEQALRLVHAIDVEPWPKRIDQLRLNPRDNGERFDVSMRLTTIFLPDRPPGSVPPPASLDDEGFARFAALARGNPFRLPPPELPAAPVVAAGEPEPPPVPPPPPGVAWSDWSLTGIVETSGDAEIWLRNLRTGETRRLVAGDRFDEIELVAARGAAAEFRLGDDRFEVRVGERLGR